jgi:hypothetical protein
MQRITHLNILAKILLIFYFLLLAMFIFAPRINVYGGLNLGVLSVLIIFSILYKKIISALFIRNIFLLFIIIFGIGFYHYFLSIVYDNNGTYFFSICISMCISILFGFSFVSLISTGKEVRGELIYKLIKLSVIAVFINSVILLIEFFYPEFKTVLESMLVQNPLANINYEEHAFRFRGLASAGGAALSIVNAVAVWLCVSLAIQGRISKLFALVIISTLCASNIFTGRTGLIFSLLFMFLYLLTIMKSIFTLKPKINYKFIVTSISLILFFIILKYIISNIELPQEVMNWAFEWTDGLIDGKVDSSSSDGLKDMLYLPENPIHLFFGIGFFEGYSVLYPRTDSGYLKTILSIGLILSLVFYGIIFFLIYQITKLDKSLRLTFFPLILFLFFVEIKEPFIYQNYASRIVFLLIGAYFFIIYQSKRKLILAKKGTI